VVIGSKADLIPDRLRACELHLKCLLSAAEEKRTPKEFDEGAATEGHPYGPPMAQTVFTHDRQARTSRAKTEFDTRNVL